MAGLTEGLADAPWWGFQLFRGRDSDWFVAQGYGRRIFIDASLNGGENLFYFQPATRYLVFIQHILFGENDVLLGVLMGVSALTAVVFTARQALKHFSGSREQHLTTLFIVACFVMFTEQIFFSFAIAPGPIAIKIKKKIIDKLKKFNKRLCISNGFIYLFLFIYFFLKIFN